LVEVVRFFVTYGLARNKTGSVKDGITELYQKKKISHTKWIIEKKNVSRTCSFKFCKLQRNAPFLPKKIKKINFKHRNVTFLIQSPVF
jgi:hypothetical protein